EKRSFSLVRILTVCVLVLDSGVAPVDDNLTGLRRLRLVLRAAHSVVLVVEYLSGVASVFRIHAPLALRRRRDVEYFACHVRSSCSLMLRQEDRTASSPMPPTWASPRYIAAVFLHVLGSNGGCVNSAMRINPCRWWLSGPQRQ